MMHICVHKKIYLTKVNLFICQVKAFKNLPMASAVTENSCAIRTVQKNSTFINFYAKFLLSGSQNVYKILMLRQLCGVINEKNWMTADSLRLLKM